MNFLRVSILASASLLATGIAAQAADLTYEPAPVPVVEAAPAFNWTGFYLGVHAGAAIVDGELNAGPYTFSDTNTGFLGGVQAGYNWQFDSLVIGAQTDFAYTSAKFSDDFSDFEAKLEWLGTTTARVGYAVDNFLLYGKGGVAYGQSKVDVVNFDDSKWHVGWT